MGSAALHAAPLVVYTAWLGHYDDVLQPITLGPSTNVVYRCFTDDPTFACPGWTMLRVPAEANPTRHARRLKILAHQAVPDAVISLWLDASLELRVPPRQIVAAALASPPTTQLAAFPHPERTTVAQEAAVVVEFGLAPATLVTAQMAAYAADGFDPAATPALTGTGLLVRRHTPAIAAFNVRWWELFTAAGHTRDQLSVDRACADVALTPTYLPGHYRANAFVQFYSPRAGRVRRAAVERRPPLPASASLAPLPARPGDGRLRKHGLTPSRAPLSYAIRRDDP